MRKASGSRLQRAAGRLAHPPRLLNWLRARNDRQERPERMTALPLGIDVEPTTRCNLRCRICQRSEAGWPELDMPVERFERVLEQMPQLEQLKLQGIGEPLLHERLFDLVRLAVRRGLRVATITNGTTLARVDQQEAILASGLEALRVSIDGATPETHAHLRPGADLAQILDDLRHLVERRRRARRPFLGIWCVGNVRNLAELTALVDLAAGAGVDELVYQADMTGWGKAEWLARVANGQIDPEQAECAARIAEARQRARERGLAFVVYEGNRFSAARPCFWPWQSCFVSAGGYVTRCCILSDPRLHHFGRIDEWDFASIWNAAEYRELRRAIRENHIPPLCRPCYGKPA